MSTIVSAVIDLAQGGGCGALKLEVPDGEVSYGDAIEIRLRAGAPDLLTGWSLLAGTTSLGTGDLVEDGDELETQEQVDLAEEYEAQLEWPATGLHQVEALTELFALDAAGLPETWASRGELVTDRCSRQGYSCLRVGQDKTPLYGSVAVTYDKAAWYLTWSWTVPERAGDQWFFLLLDGAVYSKFAIEIPELATSSTEPKNITIHAYDEASEVDVPDAEVWLDGLYVGITGADGTLAVDDVAAGEHTIKIVAPGYLATDEDELSNDAITV
jgi:hypothetical protein